MNIRVEKECFQPLLTQIQGLLEKRTNISAFENILIQSEKDRITLLAADSELSFSGSFPGKAESSGNLIMNGKRLFEIVRELSEGEILISEVESGESEGRIQITQGDSKFHIHSLKDEDFPVFPPIRTKEFQKFRASDLTEAIEKTVYCSSLDDSRHHLMGAFLESYPEELKYRWAATDGYRMSFIDTFVDKVFTPEKKKPNQKKPDKSRTDENPLETENSMDLGAPAPMDKIIIPRKGLQEIKKMLIGSKEEDFAQLAVEIPRLVVRFKEQRLSVRLIEGEYPNYKKLIPEDPGKEIVLNREEFLTGLRRVSVLAGNRFKGVTFSFTKGKLVMEFRNTDTGEDAKETINCQFTGTKKKIRLNSRYVLDVLNSMTKSEVKMFFKSPSSQCLFEEEGDRKENKNYTCIVMPMRF